MANPQVAVAVPVIDHYDTWAPVSNDALDLRLTRRFERAKVDQLLCEKAKEMGQSLQSLYTYCSDISVTSLKVLHTQCPHLKNLNLRYAYEIEETALDVIAQFNELEMLNLDNAKLLLIERGVIRGLERAFPISKVNDAVVKKILDNCPNLQRLDVSGSKITMASLRAMANHSKLTYVRVNQCFELEKEEIKRFANQNPRLSIDTDLHLFNDLSELAYKALVANVKTRYVRSNQVDQSIILSKDTPNIDCINPEVFLHD